MEIILWIQEDFSKTVNCHCKHGLLYHSQLKLICFETVFVTCNLSAQIHNLYQFLHIKICCGDLDDVLQKRENVFVMCLQAVCFLPSHFTCHFPGYEDCSLLPICESKANWRKEALNGPTRNKERLIKGNSPVVRGGFLVHSLRIVWHMC